MYPHETLRVLLELHNLPISSSSLLFHRLLDHKQVDHNFVVLVAPIVFSAKSHIAKLHHQHKDSPDAAKANNVLHPHT